MTPVIEMQKAFYQHTFQRYELTAPNVYPDWEFNEMDIFALRRSGYIDEIEIKRSKADFLADFKKTIKVKGKKIHRGSYSYDEYIDILKHDAFEYGIPHCNYFSFLIPEDLVDKCDIPEYAGLYVYKVNRHGEGRVTEIKTAKLLHKRKISNDMKYAIARKMAYRYWKAI